MNSSVKKSLIAASGILTIAACIADMAMIYAFGKQIPGYNQLTDSLSSLGISESPVASQVCVWSVTLGIVFILFAIGFRSVFSGYGKNARIASWLIILYGLGECVASGVFRADTINGQLTSQALVHDLLGGIGVTALILLPLVLMRIFTRELSPAFYRFSQIAFVIGLTSTLLFAFRINYFRDTFLHIYSGVWQRIFLVNFYAYFITLAIIMINKTKKKTI